MQAGIKLAIGSGRDGAETLKAMAQRAKELKKSRNAYVVGLIKEDLARSRAKQNGKA